MKIYADTSILLSLYVTDANSPKADAWRQANPVPLDFTEVIMSNNSTPLTMFHPAIRAILDDEDQEIMSWV